MAHLVRTNARGEREHLTQDGWVRVDHGSSLPPSLRPGLALEEPLELAPNVRADLTVRDALAPVAGTTLALPPVIPAHDAPHSASETATLDFSRVENV